MNIESNPSTRPGSGSRRLPLGVVGYAIPSGRRPRPRYKGPEPVPQEFLESARARAAMADRDVYAVFALLQRMGVSQRRIAALTGQAQSEISEILAGRLVRAVDVIERVADGLGTPRGWWGLAHSEAVDSQSESVVDAVPEVPVEQVAQISTPVVMSRQAQWAPGTRRPLARVSPVEAAMVQHLNGLIRSLRASLAPHGGAIRPARNVGPGPARARRVRRS